MKRIGLLLLVSGCSSQPGVVEQAKAELEIVEKTAYYGSEVCAAKRRLADAYLTERNEEQYRLAASDANVTCKSAEMGIAVTDLEKKAWGD